MAQNDSRTLYDMKLTSGMSYIYGPDGKRAHEQALKKDKDKSYRLVLNIVGKVRQGKTSLRRLLTGEDFNEIEQSTVGIEHELVETLGTSPAAAGFWTKVDLRTANIDECDLIVGKHVRKRLRGIDKGNKYKAELYSFFKATILSYFMLALYFSLAESDLFANIPWFPYVLMCTYAFAGLFLYSTLRDGFGMATGVLCLVVYANDLLQFRRDGRFVTIVNEPHWMHLLSSCIWMVLYYGIIHAIMAFCMGLSMGMGFCFILCSMQPPWDDKVLEHSPFWELRLHLFVLSILVGIWTLRHPKLILYYAGFLLLTGCNLPLQFLYCILSGLACGFSHAICIKSGFDVYVKVMNPYLKLIAGTRRARRFICYALGLIPGLFFTWVLGWNYPSKLMLHSLSGAIFVCMVEGCHYVLEGKSDSDPKATINNATKILNANTEASLKFVIRDFAGHPLYHSVHHVYMMGHSVYIIVFNLVEAKQRFKAVIADILYWLQAVFVHDRYPSVRAVIVGTHRDDRRLSKDDKDMITNQIMANIPRQFYNTIVWNKQTDKPVFYVENSLRDLADQDHLLLRKQLMKIATDSMKPEYPIKYLYFFRVINQCREKGHLIETLDRIEELCIEHDCLVTGDGELEDLLTYFHECGEVIYNSYDNNQNQLVVLDPKALVAIMVSLVRVPPSAERNEDHRLAWHAVDELGIATEYLLHHILQRSPLISDNVSLDTIVDLLHYLDLICKLNLGIDGRDVGGENCYLLTPLIKDTLPYQQNYWHDTETDTIVFADFGPVVPKFIFIRLVSQCSAESNIEIGMDGRYHLNVSTSKALFTYRHSFCYKLELQSLSENTSPTQQLLKIVIRGQNQESRMELLRSICQKICNIVQRDFRKCRYKIGILCPYKEPHDYCHFEERHIFPLYESIKHEGGRPHTPRKVKLPQEKEMVCRGRGFMFSYGQVVVPNGTQETTKNQNQQSLLSDMHVLDLPPRLYSDVCDDLNVMSLLKGDWSGLAGEIGYTQEQISLLSLRSPRDPCDALLQDWSTKTTDTTVNSLVQSLRRINRMDVVKKIEDFIGQQ